MAHGDAKDDVQDEAAEEEQAAPAETGDHRFAADDEVADGAAGAEEARTPGMGS